MTSPVSVDFGSVTVGTAATQTIQLSNNGRGDVTIAAMSTSGPGFTAIGPVLPLTLAPGASVTFQASFSPGNAGSATGGLYWSGNNGSVLVTVPLSETAVVQHTATLNWIASTSAVVGYYVYGGDTSGGPYSRITASVVGATSYTDSTVQAGAVYFYVVTAIDANNNESVYSSEIQAVIPSP